MRGVGLRFLGGGRGGYGVDGEMGVPVGGGEDEGELGFFDFFRGLGGEGVRAAGDGGGGAVEVGVADGDGGDAFDRGAGGRHFWCGLVLVVSGGEWEREKGKGLYTRSFVLRRVMVAGFSGSCAHTQKHIKGRTSNSTPLF